MDAHFISKTLRKTFRRSLKSTLRYHGNSVNTLALLLAGFLQYRNLLPFRGELPLSSVAREGFSFPPGEIQILLSASLHFAAKSGYRVPTLPYPGPVDFYIILFDLEAGFSYRYILFRKNQEVVRQTPESIRIHLVTS